MPVTRCLGTLSTTALRASPGSLTAAEEPGVSRRLEALLSPVRWSQAAGGGESLGAGLGPGWDDREAPRGSVLSTPSQGVPI